MKNKNIFFSVIFLLFGKLSFSQSNVLSLKQCIDFALENKNNIKAIKADSDIEVLKTDALKLDCWPQVSLAYEYRYNPIIRTNILPIGAFSATPTKETRAVKFGTNFQQTAGLAVLQPLFDATISSKIKESKILEKIKKIDIKIAEEALVYEVAKSYINLMLLQKQIKISEVDTGRTWKTLQFSITKFESGTILKIEVNNATINHNNALTIFKNDVKSLVNENIYLSFLIGKKYDGFSIQDNDVNLDINLVNKNATVGYNPSLEKLATQNLFLDQEISTQNKKTLPTISVNGYLAADQFADQLNPFLKNSWYANSYISLNVKWDLFNAKNIANKKSQFIQEKKSNDFKIKEILEEVEKDKRIAENEIIQLKTETDNLNDNVNLYKDNLRIIELRLSQGQASINDVNNEEIVYQKENEKWKNSEIKFWLQWLELVKSSGLLYQLYTNK
jgi:outer membrane protein